MRRLVSGCAAAVLAATLVAACGSSSKPEAGGDTTTSAGSSGGGGNSDNFSALLDNLSRQAFKVTWTDGSGTEHTDAQDGKGNTMSLVGDTQVFRTSGLTVTCSKSATWTCTQTSVNIGSNSGYAAISAAEKNYVTALADHFGSTSQKTIAGRDADCFTITAKDFGAVSAVAGALGASLKGALMYCNDHQTGVVLENTATDEQGDTSTILLVTEFGQPSGADFEPPATPTIITVPTITPPGGVGAQ
jgi:hypothetical protein